MTTRFNRRDLLKKSAAATGAVVGIRMFAAPAILAERAPNSDLRARLEHVGNRTAPSYAGPDMSHPPWHHGPDAVVLIVRPSR